MICKNISFGIALSGGGTRGAAHVGVLAALEEHRLAPYAVAGTSAGSIVAGAYAAGVKPTELIQMVYELAKSGKKLIDPDYLGIIKAIYEFFISKPISLTGILKGNKLERYLAKLTDYKDISEIKMKTVIPAVDINSGNTIAYTNYLQDVSSIPSVEWKNNIPLYMAMRASCAVPTVFQPKIIDDLCLVDGSVTDNLPVNLLLATGVHNILAVDISANYKKPKIDNFMEISIHSYNITGRRLSDLNSIGEKLLLNPALPDKAGLLTFSHMIQCMEIGYAETVRQIPLIKAIFQS